MTNKAEAKDVGSIFEGRPKCPPFLRGAMLLALLQTRQTFTGSELAERIGVNDRTLRRYIGELGALGFEVEGRPGFYGGYQLKSVDAIPPLIFSEDEMETILAGLAYIRYPEDEYAERANDLEERIRKLLPEAFLESLRMPLLKKYGEGYQMRVGAKASKSGG
ncbi:HTH domain-containing protein [Corynebacterium sp. CCUG 71335]|uniref:helix-turn-helix transcriptional regulator n=1 Tax=Corynebacterium sp. CCUG 71335 TaxID=2823892 RepID=UPI00210A2756|nr:HTH domain-containing protein [Corynebacterium sp. CCUG 71335]MCQ4621599.1 HTH domain-containing protein [Corynebacterium sp. CCUG 71335]